MAKKFKVLIMTMCLLFVLTSCKDPMKEDIKEENKKEEVFEPKYGGEINLPLTNLKTLNPLLNKNELYYYFNKLVYESLFEIDESFDVAKKLVDSYYIEDEGKTVRINLRNDVFWHDGEQLKAEDVIFTLDCIKKLGEESIYGNLIAQGLNTYGNFNLNRDIKMEGSGLELIVEYSQPYGNNLEVLTFPIIPSHLFKNVNEALNPKDYTIMGTGPFKLDTYGEFKELRLAANESYRDGKPYLDYVNGVILDDKEDIMMSFETGQLNAIIDMGNGWEKYGKNSRMKIMEYPSSSYEFLGFNFKNEIFEGNRGKHLRKAIAYAIDNDEIIDKAYLGHAKKTDLPLQPNSWLNMGSRYDFDKKAAIEELKFAGYKNKDADGYYLDEDNNRLKFKLLTDTLNPTRFNAADNIRKNLKAIGIEVELWSQEQSTNLTTKEEKDKQWDLVQSEIAKGNYDLVLSGWDLSYIPDLSFMFSSSKIGSSNFINYSNNNTDKLLENVFYSGGSREVKLNNYKKLNNNLIENLPYASICFKNKALIIDNKFAGENKPTFYNPYKKLDKLFIK